MRLYEEKFENNKIMYFHDLWEYVERRLADQDGATVIKHPNDEKQHASVPMANPNGQGGPYSHVGATQQPHAFIKQAIEVDQINTLSGELQSIQDSDNIPDWVKD